MGIKNLEKKSSKKFHKTTAIYKILYMDKK